MDNPDLDKEHTDTDAAYEALAVKPGEKYTLKKRIELGVEANKAKIIISEITLTDDPIAEHVEELDYAIGDVSGALRLLAAFSGLEYHVVKKMGAADLGELMPTVKYLLGKYKTLMSL